MVWDICGGMREMDKSKNLDELKDKIVKAKGWFVPCIHEKYVRSKRLKRGIK